MNSEPDFCDPFQTGNIPLLPNNNHRPQTTSAPSNTSTLSSQSSGFGASAPSPPRRLSQNNHKHYLRHSDQSELPLLDTTTCTTDSCFSTSDSLLTTPDPRNCIDDLDKSRQSSLRVRQIPSPDTTLTNLSNNSTSLLTTKTANHHHMPPLQFGFLSDAGSRTGNGSLMLSAESLPNNPGANNEEAKRQRLLESNQNRFGRFNRKQSLGDVENQQQKLPTDYPRLVAKNGECMVRPVKMPNMFQIYKNWFHLLIETSWRSVIGVFAASFVISWIFFGFIYFVIVYLSGDMQKLPEHKQCIANVHTFTGAFLFSLESQQTIGYGSRYMTEACLPAFITLILQMIVGLLLQTMLAGIVVAKVLRPKKRKQEMRFSRSAVIGPLDDADQRPALMIRIADIQHRLYLAESHVRLYMAKTRINSRGEKELIGFRDMNVGYDSGWDRVLLLWPIVIRHIIDEDSPLYHMTPEDTANNNFELIMTVEGIVEATGATFQARTSFLPYEIQWGRRFTPMVHLNEKTGGYEVDYGLFDITDPCEGFVPKVVAQIQDEMEHEDEDGPHFQNKSGFT
ncbi:Inward rectifier potassium channel 2 [Aphelenchoides bicaudatus]|nr:Inward rectifier potassium channel 2 [Aphelenchoides bicaudatus]